ncbi:MAG: fumarate reductase/succinate dehydrogenase flavoprotein subunit [Microscillaceae bacterium]|nr:fumarate reductase/succinate dehydrogenase flavoprotein subunit [Microscillaceae bacterium]MDW8461462.1 fumarate reductase/succinate dehydrogenase flavoprotein subunit [Cytophagales bacterium]
MVLDSKIPSGPLAEKWTRHKATVKLVNPANKRKYDIIVVGTGLAGASAAATLAELGYNVKAFCFQDSPRRAHSIAAQGGINAAKNYKNDGDSVFRLFYDTIKGGDYRSREANVYRLAEVSVNIIDQCVAQGVPFAREYGGLLDNRSFGGAQVSRTFYAKGQTGQQLLLGAYGAMSRQIAAGKIEMHTRTEMLDLVVIDGRARGIITRNLITGKIEAHSAHAVLLCTGGYGNVFYLSTNAMGSNATAIWRAHKKGAFFGNPCFTQIHPTCIPVTGDHQSKLTLMSESLRNDGRVWVPKKAGDTRPPHEIPEEERDYFLERKYPSFGNLVPRDVASRNAKYVCDEGRGVGASKLAVYLDFEEAILREGKKVLSTTYNGEEGIRRFIHSNFPETVSNAEAYEKKLKELSRIEGEKVIDAKYGNLFQMYEKITNENPYKTPMRIYPAVHYTMGGLWVDYNLMTTIPGLYALGEANFSDHGANRLGASALMQGLADGYFIIPYTIGDYLATMPFDKVPTSHPAFKEAEENVKNQIKTLLSLKGDKTVDDYHKALGKIMWDYCGMSRNEKGLKYAQQKIQEIRAEFWQNLIVGGKNEELNQSLEKALRVADFLELGELMVIDALHRNESCGGHFREEYQTEDGEALRNDSEYAYVAAWEWTGKDKPPILHKEELNFENVKLTQRSYK